MWFLQDLLGSDITLEPHTEVGGILAANKVPPTLAPKVIEEDVPDDDDEKIQFKEAQMDLLKLQINTIRVVIRTLAFSLSQNISVVGRQAFMLY